MKIEITFEGAVVHQPGCPLYKPKKSSSAGLSQEGKNFAETYDIIFGKKRRRQKPKREFSDN